MTTIRDLARAAGVSVSTASLAVNGDPRVRPATRQKVERAAAVLDYHPSHLARSLSQGRTWSIQLLNPIEKTLSSGYFTRFVAGAHDGADLHDTTLTLAVPANPDSATKTLDRMIREQRADGVIFMNLQPDDPLIDLALARSYPHVLVGSTSRDGVATVDNDNERVATDVTRLLLERGARNIVFLNGPKALGFTLTRAQAFLDTLRAHGLEPQPNAVAYTDGTPEAAGQALTERLDAGEPIDAVLAISDILAVAAMQVLRQRGLTIPGDVRVFGINDDDVGRYALPRLSTVDLRAYELGREAADLLLQQVEGTDTAPVRRIVGHQLIERESSA